MAQFQPAQEKLTEYEEAFALYKDDNGHVMIKDLESLMKSLGKDLTKKELQKMISEVDTDGEEWITFFEFLPLMTKPTQGMSPEELFDEKYVEAFKVFDKDGNGYISAAELRYVMTDLGEKLTEEEVKEMIREADVDDDEQINYEEFVVMMSAK